MTADHSDLARLRAASTTEGAVVRAHPAGGFTIAVLLHPGSSARVYMGNFPTATAAGLVLAEGRKILAEKTGSAVAPYRFPTLTSAHWVASIAEARGRKNKVLLEINAGVAATLAEKAAHA